MKMNFNLKKALDGAFSLFLYLNLVEMRGLEPLCKTLPRYTFYKFSPSFGFIIEP